MPSGYWAQNDITGEERRTVVKVQTKLKTRWPRFGLIREGSAESRGTGSVRPSRLPSPFQHRARPGFEPGKKKKSKRKPQWLPLLSRLSWLLTYNLRYGFKARRKSTSAEEDKNKHHNSPAAMPSPRRRDRSADAERRDSRSAYVTSAAAAAGVNK